MTTRTTGYGTDIWCGDELITGRYAKGVMVVALALYRRLITPRGKLRGGEAESTYGFDLSEFIGAVGYENALGPLPGLVRNELQKDDRVSTVAVTVTLDRTEDGLIFITLSIEVLLQDSDQVFTLTVKADDTTTTLLGVAA